MRNIKLTLAYDGAAFHGWQIQPGLPTIQGAVTDIIRQITQEPIIIHGASRTDTGVHAFGQVASFKTKSLLAAEELQRALNALLPPAIRVVAAEEMGPDFHARWQALEKTYHYRIFCGPVVSPFEYQRVLHYPYPLDQSAMQEAAKLFEGEHDFTSFAASSGSEDTDKDRSPLRVILRSVLVPHPDKQELIYEVTGRSFLRYMVRKIVGTLLEVGRGKLSPAAIPALFESRDRSLSGPTADPAGLYLVALKYPEPWKIG
ncbi:MAG TPA: tRNA pseudouridine(38-40) synthase TruA [Candidatus Acidoferrales bacterium]|nr:tRNA pseudouridine(38-40) synthase TruA [Candidatus Acidoferrales bacterium]